MIEEKLSREELLSIEDGINFYKTSGAKVLKGGILTSMIFALLLYFIMGFTFNDAVFMMVGLALFTIYIWYNIFKQPKSKLQQDFEKGIKIIQTVTINKIKKNVEGKTYQMSNGLKIKESAIDGDIVALEELGKGKELILTYTPFHKMILNIKEKKWSDS